MVESAKRPERVARMKPTKESIDDAVQSFGRLSHCTQPQTSVIGAVKYPTTKKMPMPICPNVLT
jgi:hypothetical protein